jgi:putative membrane protein
MFFSMLLFSGGLIALIVWAVRTTSDRTPAQPHGRALNILEDRYARGEIDHDEFKPRRRTLKES